MKSETLKQQLMDQVIRFIGGRIERARAAQVEAFVRQFYANVPFADIAQDPPEDLFCAALSLWQFAHKRQPGAAKVRVFNPHQDEHGWRSSHTVIEIVNDDMPFLVDSVTAELARQDLERPPGRAPDHAHRARQVAARVTDIGKPDAPAESVMQIRATQVGQTEKLEQIAARHRIGAERRARRGRRLAARCATRLREAIEEIDRKKLPVRRRGARGGRALPEVDRGRPFHVPRLSRIRHDRQGREGLVPDRRRPLARHPASDFNLRIFGGMRNQRELPPQVRSYLRQPKLLLITKANPRATVHRDVPMDAFGVKTFDAKGNVTGERLFVGLFTSAAYSRSPREIPLLRPKVETVIERAGFSPDSHDGKALAHILETYPRDELFQASEDELLRDRDRHPATCRSASASPCSCAATPTSASSPASIFLPQDR